MQRNSGATSTAHYPSTRLHILDRVRCWGRSRGGVLCGSLPSRSNLRIIPSSALTPATASQNDKTDEDNHEDREDSDGFDPREGRHTIIAWGDERAGGDSVCERTVNGVRNGREGRRRRNRTGYLGARDAVHKGGFIVMLGASVDHGGADEDGES